MMISPSAYILQFKNSEYLDLIKERNHLIDYIQSYENSEIAGDRSGEEWCIHPQPDVRYQMYLEYLGKICELMQKKYNKEYVWGDRSLQEEAKISPPTTLTNSETAPCPNGSPYALSNNI